MKYGLIGEHLSHSFSKEIHEKLADYTYDLCPLTKEEFPVFMKQHDFKAINVTIPYKIDCMAYLDEIDEKAQAIGSVNTIVNRDDRLYGYNTDYDGFAYMLKRHGVSIQGQKVLMIGDGGAAKAITKVLKDFHAKEILKVRRSKSANTISYDEVYQQHMDADIIINTSPSGMYPHDDDDCPLDLTAFKDLKYVVDIIYNPLRTSLCVQANNQNVPSIGGLEMLIAQAKVAVEHFLSTSIEDHAIHEIYRDMMKEMTSIVLIGMPSSGKSSIGRQLAEDLHKEFYDVDTQIEQIAKKSIKNIFQDEGEAYFRDLETKVILQLSQKKQAVIATGGGSILRKQNVNALKRNGMLCYIRRDIDKLLVDDARPLSKSRAAIQEMLDIRAPLYEAAADICIDNNNDLDTVIEMIKQMFDAYCQKL